MKKRRSQETFDCPHCGQPVRVLAKACPHCGSDEETGWSDSDPELEEDEFDYDEYIEREFPQESQGNSASHKRSWTLFVIILLLASMLLSTLLMF